MVNELTRPQNNNFHDEMMEQYGLLNRFLPAVLRDLHFQVAPAGEHTLSAIHYLTELNGSRTVRLNILLPAPGNAWYTMRRAGYSVPVTRFACWSNFRMHYVDGTSENSDRWEIPAKSCCRGKNGRPVCRALRHSTDGQKGVQQLAVKLDETWKAVASCFEENAEVHICHDSIYPSLTISSLEKLEEPPSLHRLNSRVRQRLPQVDLTELLLEIDARTGFTREFTHVSESGARAQDLHISQCGNRLRFVSAQAGRHATELVAERLHNIDRKRWLPGQTVE